MKKNTIIKAILCGLCAIAFISNNSSFAANSHDKAKVTKKSKSKSKKNAANNTTISKNNENSSQTPDALAMQGGNAAMLNNVSIPSSTASMPSISSKITFSCDSGQKFNINGNIDNDNNIKLNYNGKETILTRVMTDTGANRFANSNQGYDLVVMPTNTMLMNTKSGSRIANGCMGS
jgi:hypothetical protein